MLPRIPASVCGVETAVLVVDDGSRDGTGDVARAHGAAVARHVINRGGGAALRTGYRLMADSGALVVVTLDADGQHLPEEMSRLVQPVLDGEVDVAHGSRVLGHAEPNHFARELGIVFFNRLVSFITRTKVSDCSNGYRAVRATVLPQLVLRQEQFHTSEFMIEAIKRGVPAQEVPVTVARRLHGHSKKPAVLRYGLGFANAIVRPGCGEAAGPSGSGSRPALGRSAGSAPPVHQRPLDQVPARGAERGRDRQHDERRRAARRRTAGRGRAPTRSAGCARGRSRMRSGRTRRAAALPSQPHPGARAEHQRGDDRGERDRRAEIGERLHREAVGSAVARVPVAVGEQQHECRRRHSATVARLPSRAPSGPRGAPRPRSATSMPQAK